MTAVAFALVIGFILGLPVGFLLRSESRQFGADIDVEFGEQENAEH